MRSKTIIALLLSVVMFVMAGSGVPYKLHAGASHHANDTVNDTVIIADTAAMDSLQKAIWLHNKQVDDSIRLDSINRAKSTGINSPVEYSATDSLVYDAKSKRAYLFGESAVKYENMNLKSERINMCLDSSLVHATGIRDTADHTGKTLTGTPVFTMGNDSYESDTMAFNFKSKKGLISNVYTQQEDGYMRSELSKRNDNGEIYLQHGRYTTCNAPHPDFYIAISRAKMRPGKDVVFGPAYLVVADVPLPLAIPYGFFPPTTANDISIAAASCSRIKTREQAIRVCLTI